MNFWTSNWPEICTAAIAIFALLASWKTSRDNHRYKAPAFRLTPGGLNESHQPTLKLTNNGETRAKNVSLTFAMDPTRIFTFDTLEWDVIDQRETVTITFSPTDYPTAAETDWLSWMLVKPERRKASISYTNRIGKRRSEELLTPSRDEVSAATAHSQMHRSDSQ